MGKALDAVEMSDPWPCGAPVDRPRCVTPAQPVELFYDDFEELAGGSVNDPALLSSWTQNALFGGSHWGFCCFGAFATSGTGNLFGYDYGGTVGVENGTRDSAIAMARTSPCRRTPTSTSPTRTASRPSWERRTTPG